MYSATDTGIDYDQRDQSTRKKAMVAALIALLLWFLMLLFPVFSYTFPMPEKAGILMNFGDSNGGGALTSSMETSDQDQANKPETAEAPVAEKDAQDSRQEVTARSVATALQPQTEDISFIKTTRVQEEKPDQKRKTKETQAFLDQKSAEEEAQEKETQRQKALEQQAKRKQQEASATKEFSSFFSGLGSGTENSASGDPAGEPNKQVLEGVSKGSSNIGGGLAERGVLYEPEIDDQSQKVGRIIVRVCVDSKGFVTEAKYTQRGSTSTDITLIDVAEKAAAQYRFSPSGLEKQCGTISIDFKLK